MRLIDADITSKTYTVDLFDTLDDFERVNDILKYATTVDSVPVVHCKDCKYAYYYNEEGCHGFVCNGYFKYADVEPNDFCSYADLKAEAIATIGQIAQYKERRQNNNASN